jgi:hypothetical protein
MALAVFREEIAGRREVLVLRVVLDTVEGQPSGHEAAEYARRCDVTSFAGRVQRLVKLLGPRRPAESEFRVAGKSRSEIDAEVLAHIFTKLEEVIPGFFEAVVETELRGGHLPEDLQDSVLVRAVRHAERFNPGMARRVLAALVSGRPALTEENLFPAGRPQLSYDTRDDGKKFFLPLARSKTAR